MAVAATDTSAAMGLSAAQSLESILAKLIAAPATSAKQDTINTSLGSILAKLIATPATEAKQDTIIAALATANGYLAQTVTNTTIAP